MARLTLLLPILLLEFLSAFSLHVYSFCVYNEMKGGTLLNVEQTNGQMETVMNNPKRRFNHYNIPPSSKECCPKSNRHCCIGSTPNYEVEFKMWYGDGNQQSITRAIKGQCGGYIVVKGTFENATYDNFSYADQILESESWGYE